MNKEQLIADIKAMSVLELLFESLNEFVEFQNGHCLDIGDQLFLIHDISPLKI